MGESTSDRPLTQGAQNLEDRLDSWKEIAGYLNRDVTTVQRWEKREGMPVHRHRHDRIGSVYGSKAELDAWVRSRNPQPISQAGNGTPQTVIGVEEAKPAKARSRWVYVAGVAVIALLAVGAGLWADRSEYFWRNPLSDARFQELTEFEGTEQAAAISRDGRLVAFLSDRDGPMDVWVTQVGSGEFHNLTHGRAAELVNASVRTLGFTPDASLVTFWTRRPAGADGTISVWAVPTLGGEPRPYLEGVAECDWSHDGSKVAYHTPGPGDPMFISAGGVQSGLTPIFSAGAGLHSHFPLWAADDSWLYFVQGALPDKLDIWRIRPSGGTPERITWQNSRVSHPVVFGVRTVVYLATDPDGSGPWLYSVDVERRVAHRLSSGLDRYTSLAASADGKRLVVTRVTSKRTLWRLPISEPPIPEQTKGFSEPSRIALTTKNGFAPRFASGQLLYVSSTEAGESIWELADGAGTELWSGAGAQILGGPAMSPDQSSIAFSIRKNGKSRLLVMQADGSKSRILTDSLDLQSEPAWNPGGQSITVAANEGGVPRLFRVPMSGEAPQILFQEYSVDPAWSPDGKFFVYSGRDVGTTFSVKAATAEARPREMPSLTLTRGARRMTILSGGRALVFLKGDIAHKDLWRLDLETGAEQELTKLPPDFEVLDFDISKDGREAVLERQQEDSNILHVDVKER
jgi:Tol biopolymer transport system component